MGEEVDSRLAVGGPHKSGECVSGLGRCGQLGGVGEAAGNAYEVCGALTRVTSVNEE